MVGVESRPFIAPFPLAPPLPQTAAPKECRHESREPLPHIGPFMAQHPFRRVIAHPVPPLCRLSESRRSKATSIAF
jgi:hypothetical protein